MKRMKSAQLKNYIFLCAVMLVAVAALIWLFVRGEQTSLETAAASPLATCTPAPEKYPTRVEGAPVTVFEMQMREHPALALEKDGENAYALLVRDDPAQAAITLRLTETRGGITSIECVFPRPVSIKGKPENEIEKRLKEQYDEEVAALRERVMPVLKAVIEAADVNGLLLGPVVSLWCDGAAETLSDGDSYRNVYEGCTFTAYASEEDGVGTLVCALLFP